MRDVAFVLLIALGLVATAGVADAAPNCNLTGAEFLQAYNVPEECADSPNTIDLNTVEEIYSTLGAYICRPQCGNPSLRYFQDCHPQLIDFIILLCAENSQDVSCHSTSVLSSINATIEGCIGNDLYYNSSAPCSSTCQTAVRNGLATTGCCIHLVSPLTHSCGITLPGPCTDSTLTNPTTLTIAGPSVTTSGSVAPTVSALIGALVVLMSITLPSML